MKLQDSCIQLDMIKKCQPLIKWPGGKRSLVDSILQFFPEAFDTYYEPFFGGGAVFFALQPTNAVLSDANDELVNAYVQVRDNPNELVKVLHSFKNTEQDYYLIRRMTSQTRVQRAARLLYLTRLSFNGIHRVNLRGEFNVPYGYKTHLSAVDQEQLFKASSALQNAKIESGDFEFMTRNAKNGDVVYFDPPYTVAHGHNGFVKYNERIFSWHDQQRLAEHARTLANRGCRVVVSNADHHSIHELYKGFSCNIIERSSVIAASSIHRRKITECIFSLE